MPLGQSVRTLLSSDMAAGRHELTWDGRDDRGIGLASGVYFYRLYAQGSRAQSFSCITALNGSCVYTEGTKKTVVHPASGRPQEDRV